MRCLLYLSEWVSTGLRAEEAFGHRYQRRLHKVVAGPARLLHRLPDNIPFEVGAAIEPTAICVTSILERSQLQAGETVVITGPGPIGLISLAIAKAAGVRMVGSPAGILMKGSDLRRRESSEPITSSTLTERILLRRFWR